MNVFRFTIVMLIMFGCISYSWSDEPKKNVVLISLDTLRVDYVTPEYMPFLSNLGKTNISFNNAYTTAPYTGPAHASLFTGHPSTKNGVRHNLQELPPKFKTIAEVFQEQGYKTFGFVSSILLSKKAGFQSGFDYFDSSEDKDIWITAEEQVSRVRQFLTSLTRIRPMFLFIHFSDLHQYAERDSARVQLESISPALSLEKESLRVYTKEYGKTALLLDQSLQNLFTMFSDLNLDSNTIYVVISDHGEGLGDHGLLGHVDNLHNELIKILLIIKNPNGLKSSSDSLVSIIDIPQTLAKISGGKGSLGNGTDLFSKIPDREVTSDTWTPDAKIEQHAIISGSKKMIFFPKQVQTFDLKLDPHELSPVITKRKDGDLPSYPPEEVTISPQNQEILRSLGYIQ